MVQFSLLGLSDRWPILQGVAVALWVLGIVVIGLTNEVSGFFALVWYGYRALGIALLAAVAFAFYAEAVYPRLPQSLGGGKTRCAQLDLTAAAVSEATPAALAPPSTAQTVRTRELDIVFSQEVLFVRRAGEKR